MAPARQELSVRGTSVHVLEDGTGTPLLFLHGAGGAGRWLPFQQYLARSFAVSMPSHPGHGGSPAAEWIEHISDLAFHYLDWLDAMLATYGPIRRVVPVDVRQSMANGGGPACLRLRVVADPATVDPRFLLDETKADTIADVVERHWPEQIDPADLGDAALAATVAEARGRLLEALDLGELA